MYERYYGAPLRALAGWLAVFILLGAGGCKDPSWHEVAAQDGGFRILMNGQPQVEKRDLDTPVGKITGYWYSVDRKDSVFGVGYADYPPPILRATSPREMITVVREGWLKKIAGKLDRDATDIKLDGKWFGMEFTAQGQLEGRDAWMRGRFYLVDNRLYQLVAFGRKEAIAAGEVDKFLASFKVAQPRDTSVVKIDPLPDRKQ